MNDAVDTTGFDTSPRPNNCLACASFFVVYIILGMAFR